MGVNNKNNKYIGRYNSKKNNNISNNSGQNKGGKERTGYIGAPYNFVPLHNGVYERYEKIEELPAHDNINDSLLSGEIEYTFENETEIYVSDGDSNRAGFYRDMRGNYAIPGSTVRGLIRSNMLILGFGSVKNDIQDNKFMYRTVAKAKDKEKDKLSKYDRIRLDQEKNYKSQLGIKSQDGNIKYENVKAGYIRKVGKDYYISGTKDVKTNAGTNFYVVREDYVHADDKSKERFSYIKDDLMYEDINDNGRIQNQNYKPKYKEISYSLEGNKVAAIGDPKAYKNKGYVVFTGKLENDDKKVSFYVVPEEDKGNRNIINSEFVTYFRNDVDIKKNQLRDTRDYYDLPKGNMPKPVFYMGDITKISNLGFTPTMRILYKHSVHDGIYDVHKEDHIDYISAIFGFSSNDNSYKSRVYFEDAVACGAESAGEKDYALMGPKASSYMDYLEKDYTYNSDEFHIRGIKQYWLRKRVEEGLSRASGISTKLCPLEKGCSFTGKIKFTNLAPDELGLLLWCIRLEKGCYQNIGMGKPYGFGRIKFDDNIKLRLLNNSKMYRSNSFTFDVYNSDEDPDKYIEKYKKHIKEEFLHRPVEEEGSVADFMRIKREMPDSKYIRYMSLANKEYQSRNKYLDTIEGVLKKCSNTGSAPKDIKNDKKEDKKEDTKNVIVTKDLKKLFGLFDR